MAPFNPRTSDALGQIPPLAIAVTISPVPIIAAIRGAVRHFRARPGTGESAQMPAWMAGVPSFHGWKTRLEENTSVVLAVLFVVFGVVLIGQGLQGR